MTFSIVIPTKDRHNELLTLLKSILKQTLIPNQIIIIDQSKNSFLLKKNLINKITQKKIIYDYLHNQSISGLVEAKQRSLKLNKCDYISFFDDDIVLENNYFENLHFVLKSNQSIVGLNGRIMNYPKVSFLKRIIFKLTHFGLFKDNRISNQLKSSNNDCLIKISVLSGGLSTWNRSIFDKVQFDIFNKFHAYEDQEFSIRVKKYISKELYLARGAKLYHNHSEINRTSLVKKYKGDILEVFLIYKKNKDMKFARISLIILLVGLFFNATALSISLKKIGVLKNFFLGLFEGIKHEPKK